MILDDAADNAQSQARSPFLRRKIRQEESLLQFLRDPMAGVSDRDLHRVAAHHK